MSYAEVISDLFKLDVPAIAHGCNCEGSMGGGIAVEFRDRFPEMYDEYVERCSDGRFPLGGIFVWVESSPVVYNLATQQRSGRDADLAAIRTAVVAALADAETRGLIRLGVPKLGAGIGGLRWEDVAAVLRAAAEGSTVDLVVAVRP